MIVQSYMFHICRSRSVFQCSGVFGGCVLGHASCSDMSTVPKGLCSQNCREDVFCHRKMVSLLECEPLYTYLTHHIHVEYIHLHLRKSH